jgi:anti-anti-sigma factor
MPLNAKLSWVDNDTALIVLEGELDAASAALFKDTVEKAASGKPKQLVLHLEKLTFMASAGLRVLIFAKQKMGPSAEVVVVGAQPKIIETIRMTGFDRSIRIEPTRA